MDEEGDSGRAALEGEGRAMEQQTHDGAELHKEYRPEIEYITRAHRQQRPVLPNFDLADAIQRRVGQLLVELHAAGVFDAVRDVEMQKALSETSFNEEALQNAEREMAEDLEAWNPQIVELDGLLERAKELEQELEPR